MSTIKTQNNLECALAITKLRLNLLIDRKNMLYAEYCPTAQKLSDDKKAQYLHELYNTDTVSGYSLAQEIKYQKERVNILTHTINRIDKTLNNLKGIEFVLLCEIVINGVNTSKAVRDIAQLYKLAEGTVWRYHYKKIKDVIPC